MGIVLGRGNCIFEIGDLKKEMVGKKEEKSRILLFILWIYYSVFVGCDSYLEVLVYIILVVNIFKRMRVENFILYCIFLYIELVIGIFCLG